MRVFEGYYLQMPDPSPARSSASSVRAGRLRLALVNAASRSEDSLQRATPLHLSTQFHVSMQGAAAACKQAVEGDRLARSCARLATHWNHTWHLAVDITQLDTRSTVSTHHTMWDFSKMLHSVSTWEGTSSPWNSSLTA